MLKRVHPLFIHLSLIFWFCSWVACSPQPAKESTPDLPPTGSYTGTLDIQGEALHFDFELSHEPKVFRLHNHEESFEITEFKLTADSLVVPLHIFDTELRAVFKDGRFTGFWSKKYADGYQVPFTAEKSTEVNSDNTDPQSPPVQLALKYRVYFESEIEDSTVAIGQFEQNGSDLKGTFLTETGDYRYLKGKVEGHQLKLSTFDGEHAFVFSGTVNEQGVIDGTFLSGKTWHENWTAYADPKVVLADAGSLTYLKDSFKTLSFKGLNKDGNVVDQNSAHLKDKPILLQIMGSWCPNCMDETAFLSQWSKTKKPENLEIISLAFERKADFTYAQKRLDKLRLKYSVDYPLLFGGIYHKDSAAAVLPELSSVVAYPTLIFMDAQHEVTHIHTGFTGPGTGDYFERWKLDFAKRIEEIAP